MRRLMCLLLGMTLLCSGCGKLSLPFLPWQSGRNTFAVVDWDKLVKEHPKYKELVVSGESVDNVIRMRERQLQVGRHQLNLLARMQSFKNQGKVRFRQAQFSAKMAERQAIENDRLKKLEESTSLEVEKEVAGERAAAQEAFRLPLLNLRMKLESVKMTDKARAEVLQELEEVMKARRHALALLENKKAQLVNQRLQGELKAAQDRLEAYAKSLGESGTTMKIDGTTVDSKEGQEELDKLLASMDEQIKIKREIYVKIQKNINSDIETALKKINLEKKYTLILKNVRANPGAEDITDRVSAEVKNIAK